MSWWRAINLISAVLVSALAPTILFGAISAPSGAGVVAIGRLVTFIFVIALLHSVVLGLPLFLLFRPRGWVNGLSSIFGGFTVGCIPVGIFIFATNLPGESNTSVWGPGGVPFVVDGVTTVAAWLSNLKLVLQFGGYGALGGLAFWVVLRMTRDLPMVTGNTDSTAQIALNGSRKSPVLGSSIVVGTLVLSAGALLAPTITKDRSCHNLFLDGRDSIGPEATITLDITEDEWLDLTEVMSTFSAENELSFRNSNGQSINIPLDVSFCSDAGFKFQATSMTSSVIPDSETVRVAIYLSKEQAPWQIHARDLITELDRRWPQKVIFNGPAGSTLTIPDERL